VTQHVYLSWVSSSGPWNVSVVGPAVTQFNATGLTFLSNFWVRVSASNWRGSVDRSVMFRTIRVPDPPTSVAAPSAELLDTSLVATYMAPAFTGEASLVSFTVYIATSLSGPFAVVANVDASVNDVYAGGLSSRTNYVVGVTATNRAGEGAMSVVLATRTIARPGAPVNFFAPIDALLNTSYELTWSAHSDNGDASLSSYVVYVSASAAGPFAELAVVTGLVYNVSGLSERASRYYVVRASNRAGLGSNSSVLNVRTIARPSSPAFIVAQLTSVSKSTIVLSWKPPLDPGDAPVLAYRLYSSTSARATCAIRRQCSRRIAHLERGGRGGGATGVGDSSIPHRVLLLLLVQIAATEHGHESGERGGLTFQQPA
jgi:hypothetical protein